MWLQQKLNPAAHRPDAGDDLRLDALGLHVHAGRLRLGLVIYWIANNTSHLHPAIHHHARHGYTPDLFGNITAEEPEGAEADADGRSDRTAKAEAPAEPDAATQATAPPAPTARTQSRRKKARSRRRKG
jgi:hypothetical protein